MRARVKLRNTKINYYLHNEQNHENNNP
uniref:Uncharacterized protein n=1 Tax=Arundo donax TaxID=35708 RepID=A0A0A8XUW9_ARUDO